MEPYCTELEALQAMGRSTIDDPDTKANINRARTAAAVAINNTTHRRFDKVTGVRAVGSKGGHRLDIPDLVSASAVAVDANDDGVFETTVAAADYELGTWYRSKVITIDEVASTENWPWEFITLLTRPWPTGLRSTHVRITGDWGWGAVPETIREANAMLTVRFAQRMQQAPFGTQSWGELGATPIRKSDPDVDLMLQPYVRTGLA